MLPMKKNKKKYNEIKTCPICNREFLNRKKWRDRGLWASVVYCSKRCRSSRKN